MNENVIRVLIRCELSPLMQFQSIPMEMLAFTIPGCGGEGRGEGEGVIAIESRMRSVEKRRRQSYIRMTEGKWKKKQTFESYSYKHAVPFQ